MRPASLCPDSKLWRVGWMAVEAKKIVLHLRPVRALVQCPLCGVASRRVHSVYQRKALDLPWFSWPVQLAIQARRFFCDTPACRRRIFTEPFPKVLDRYALQTQRTLHLLLELAHCSNAEMAATVARLLGFMTSPDSLIRIQRQETFSFPSPRVVGVDEFALRKGRTYGTLLVDLERRIPLELLEGTNSSSLIHWLQAQSSLVALARDRSGAFAQAVRPAVPHALQIADRFHLVKNVLDALKDLVRSRRWEQPSPAARPEKPGPLRQEDPNPTLQEPKPTPFKQARWEAVQAEKPTGKSLRAIARELGINRKTVRKYLAADRPSVYPGRRPEPTKVGPYLEHLRRRWEEGCHNAHRLYQELVEMGYRGGQTQIRSAVRPWRFSNGIPEPARRPTPFHWLALKPQQRLTHSEQEELVGFLEANPLLAEAHALKERFLSLVANMDVATLDVWLNEAAESGLSTFRRLARSIRRDYEAVRMALSTPWSTGQCEGQICRVKLVKR
ncbi:MAG: ISL3 family transposase, partial [Chloroflexi bacterium]|nr:ISL3 family transposase [Chloroflexota bacterium]